MMLYAELCKKSLLTKCWNAIYRGKSVPRRATSRGIDNITLEEFKRKEDVHLKEIRNALLKKTYEFAPSKVIAIPKDDKAPRMIAMQTIADRIVHKTVLSLITEPLFPFVNTGVSYCGVKKVYWSIKEKSLNRVDAIKKLIEKIKCGNFWIFETDIESFFDEIPKDEIIKKLKKALKSDQSLLPTLNEAIAYEIGNPSIYEKFDQAIPDKEKGVPQGSSLSPLLSNLYLADFDNYMKARFGDNYIRYADDFIVMCNSSDEAKRAKKCAKYKIRNQQLKLKSKKTHLFDIRHKPLKFLGLKLDRHGIVPKKTIGAIKTELSTRILNPNEYGIQYRAGNRISKIDQMNEKIIGWAYGYRFFHAQKYFEEIDELITSRIKCSRGNLIGLKHIKKHIKLEPIINQQSWQQMFTKTKGNC